MILEEGHCVLIVKPDLRAECVPPSLGRQDCTTLADEVFNK